MKKRIRVRQSLEYAGCWYVREQLAQWQGEHSLLPMIVAWRLLTPRAQKLTNRSVDINELVEQP